MSTLPCWSQAATSETTTTVTTTTQQVKDELVNKEAPLFGGVAIMVDIVGPVMYTMNADFGSFEAAARVNLKHRYFPIFELGYGMSDYEDSETQNTYKVQAPYFRLGMDYNFFKNWRSGNRLFFGARYAFSSFKYDIAAPALVDPVWNEAPFNFNYPNLSGNYHWGEVVFGIETSLRKTVHLGWNVRYKIRIAQKTQPLGSPWYVPGFGKSDTSCLGGGFNVIIDI